MIGMCGVVEDIFQQNGLNIQKAKDLRVSGGLRQCFILCTVDGIRQRIPVYNYTKEALELACGQLRGGGAQLRRDYYMH